MIPGLLTFFERVGLEYASVYSGVSLNTLVGIATGRQALGSINEARLRRAMGNYRVNLLTRAGASRDTAEVARDLPFATVDKYAARMESVVDALVRDNMYDGANFTEDELRESILKNLRKSDKGVKEMYDRYVG